MEAAVNAWDEQETPFVADSLNNFIESHEFTLLTFGEKITR